MNRRIIVVLLLVIALGLLALFAMQRGPVLLLKPPTAERIAFISDRDGRPDIWTVNTDGSDLAAVTDDDADDRAPAWSPDAREIASVSDREGGSYQVFVSAWNGAYTRVMTISEGIKDEPRWSTDGKEITFISSGRVFRAKRHGGREEQLLPPLFMPEEEKIVSGADLPYVYASWSPNGRTLLFLQDTGLGRAAAVIEASDLGAGAGFQPFVLGTARSLDVAWSPDGQRVALAFMNRKGENGLYVMDLQAVEGRDLFVTKGDGRGAARPVWSPDGTQIAFEMWNTEDSAPTECLGIYVINSSGGEPKPAVNGDSREPCWSPDGKQIACSVSRDDGGRDIWVVNADGTDARNLTVGEGDSSSPAWSPSVRAR